MTDKFKNMDAEDLTTLISSIVQYDTTSKEISVRDVREELGLAQKEYNEIYDISMPAIRGYNEGKFWRNAYHVLECNLMNVLLASDLPAEKTLERVRKVLKQKSSRMLKQEQEKGWPFNAQVS